MKATAVYLYKHNGEQFGPVSPSQLKALGTAGEIKPYDLIQRVGTPDWVPASKFKDLFPAEPPAIVSPPRLPVAGQSEQPSAMPSWLDELGGGSAGPAKKKPPPPQKTEPSTQAKRSATMSRKGNDGLKAVAIVVAIIVFVGIRVLINSQSVPGVSGPLNSQPAVNGNTARHNGSTVPEPSQVHVDVDSVNDERLTLVAGALSAKMGTDIAAAKGELALWERDFNLDYGEINFVKGAIENAGYASGLRGSRLLDAADQARRSLTGTKFDFDAVNGTIRLMAFSANH